MQNFFVFMRWSSIKGDPSPGLISSSVGENIKTTTSGPLEVVINLYNKSQDTRGVEEGEAEISDFGAAPTKGDVTPAACQ